MSTSTTERKQQVFFTLKNEQGEILVAYKNGTELLCFRAFGNTLVPNAVNGRDITLNSEDRVLLEKRAVDVLNQDINNLELATELLENISQSKAHLFVNAYDRTNKSDNSVTHCRHAMIYFEIVLSDELIKKLAEHLEKNRTDKSKHHSLWFLPKTDAEKFSKEGKLAIKLGKPAREILAKSVLSDSDFLASTVEISFMNYFVAVAHSLEQLNH